jgi:hypothetical protein
MYIEAEVYIEVAFFFSVNLGTLEAVDFLIILAALSRSWRRHVVTNIEYESWGCRWRKHDAMLRQGETAISKSRIVQGASRLSMRSLTIVVNFSSSTK